MNLYIDDDSVDGVFVQLLRRRDMTSSSRTMSTTPVRRTPIIYWRLSDSPEFC